MSVPWQAVVRALVHPLPWGVRIQGETLRLLSVALGKPLPKDVILVSSFSTFSAANRAPSLAGLAPGRKGGTAWWRMWL